MEDLARRTEEWKDSHPLKEWRRRNAYSTQQAALVLDITESRILTVEGGEAPTDDEMKIITQRTGITKDLRTKWERALPRSRAVAPRG